MDILTRNIPIWCKYWKCQTNYDLQSLYEKIDWQKGSTRTTLLMFLAQTKIISKIVPKNKKDKSLSEIEEALMFGKHFLGQQHQTR
jgi:hypothetical protein